MLKRFIPLAICGPLIALATACSPEQIQTWLAWHAQDPAAAEQWANEQCGELCNHGPGGDWDQDGVVEPETPTRRIRPTSTTVAPRRATASTPAPAPSGGSSRWDRIAQCESGGNWSYPLVTNRTGTYSGGLMIWTKAWDAYGGNEFASDAYLASKAQQIIVAERILADNGWSAWDCA